MSSAISGYIATIRNAVYGEQVRGAIANALEACYSDVENPDLQSAAFLEAIEEAYENGVLDIIEVTQVSAMTNENIIYRYMGTETGYTANTLYFHNGSAWVPIGSGVRTVATASLMTDTGAIYKYTGTETGYVQNALYYHNGTTWVPVAPLTDKTLSVSGSPADAEATGDKIAQIAIPYSAKLAIVSMLNSAIYTNANQAKNADRLAKWLAGTPEYSNNETWSSGVVYDLDILTGKGTTTQSGVVVDAPNYNCTDFGYCEGADFLYFKTEYNQSYLNLWFYDSSKTPISRGFNGIYNPVPSNAVYFTVSGNPANVSNAMKTVSAWDADDFEVSWSSCVPYRGVTVFPYQSTKDATGVINQYSDYSMAYMVNCSGVETLYFPPATGVSGTIYFWFYDSTKAPLSRFSISASEGTFITVPSQAAYFNAGLPSSALTAMLNTGIVPYLDEDLT